jgi:cysteine desulfurase
VTVRARVYLDNAATTRPDPAVIAAMTACWDADLGNPSSLHAFGRGAREGVEIARARVAGLLNAAPGEIVFTASGTEADNLALRGVLARGGGPAGRLAVAAFEHPAVLETARALAAAGCAVDLIPVDADGIVQPSALAATLRPDTRLVSVMAANNVVGTLQPVAELCALAHAGGALFHTDAVQAAGKIPLDVRALGADLVSVSAHKLHGPQGVGALYVRDGLELAPIVHGGGQEHGLRSATENVAGLAGFGVAADLAREEMGRETARLVALRERIVESLASSLPEAYLIGHRWQRLPGHLCFGFAGLEGDAIRLLLALDAAGIAVSAGSACSARHAAGPSHVLQAMGFDPIRARGSLRVTLGRFTTDADIACFLDALPAAVRRMRPVTSTSSPAGGN